MRQLIAMVAAFMLLPSSVGLAADLEELLEESRTASYSAEQLIVCDTPDGSRDALIQLQQRSGEVRYYGKSDSTAEVWTGYGNWVIESDGSVKESTELDEDEAQTAIGQRYELGPSASTLYLGRRADRYRLIDGDVARAELVIDRATGVLLSVVTFDDSGSVYCERNFVSFNPTEPSWNAVESSAESGHLVRSHDSDLPEELAGFMRLDVYVDDAGLDFAYYSDGFFSFAVFESEIDIVLDDAVTSEVGGHVYQRAFSPGQVTYTWPVRTGGMALIGDLPPDMHADVLDDLPTPYDAGFFRRLWRSLFG